jgi:colicin import membrane protein
MARKLKSYVTTSGFFELAVAAPSKKAASETLGIKETAFSQGFAHETDDAAIIAATMAKPGVILRRAVGTEGTFSEEAELPKLSALQSAITHKRPANPRRLPAEKTNPGKTKKPDAAASRKAAQLYDLAEKRRQREEERAEAQRAKQRERTERAVEKAQAALDKARSRHDERAADFEKQRETVDRKARLEGQRWQEEEEKLKAALRDARDE